MPSFGEQRKLVMQLCEEAISQTPEWRPPELSPTKLLPDVPEWQAHEHEIWRLGEEARLAMNEQPKLRTDQEFYSKIAELVRDRAAMRGRQSWVLLYAYKSCATWGTELVSLLPDADIDGHVISALCKMKATGFTEQIQPYCSSKTTWIKKKAELYLSIH